MKERIALRVEERLGGAALDRLNGLFVGTIHAYCFRLLQQHLPRYESYDVLDDNQPVPFLAREGSCRGIGSSTIATGDSQVSRASGSRLDPMVAGFFAYDLACGLVEAQAEEGETAQAAVRAQLHERDLGHELGLDPQRGR